MIPRGRIVERVLNIAFVGYPFALLLIVLSLLFPSSAVAEKLFVGFPLHIKYGMTRIDVETIIGTKADSGTNRWPIPGQITYKSFRPSHVVVFFKADKRESDAWRKNIFARFRKAKTDAERHAIMDAPMPEFKTNQATSINLFQQVADCDELHSIFSDAFEFVTTSYDVRQKNQVTDDLLRSWSCLNGKSHFTFVGSNGYGIELKAEDDPAGGGGFYVNITYSKGAGSLDKDHEKTNPNL